MQEAFTMDRLSQMSGEPVYDTNGEKIGSVQEIYYDQDTEQPEWIGIGVGFFGTKRVLVPVQGANASEDGLTVAYEKSMVKDAPDIDLDGDDIDEQSERSLYSYYGIQASERRSDSTLPDSGRSRVGGDIDRQTGLPNADEQSMTRSEEELRVGKREVEAGRVRLRKWVESEPVEESVELKRDTVHVRREAIDQPASGGEIGEQTIDVPLHAEEAVVDKQVRAKERVSLDKDVERRTETVSDEVRKERVGTEGDLEDDDPETTSRI